MDDKTVVYNTILYKKAKALLTSKTDLVGAAEHPYTEALAIIEELLANQASLEKQNAELVIAVSEQRKERAYLQNILNDQPAGLYRIRVFTKEKRKNKSWASSANPPYSLEMASDSFCDILGVSKKEFADNPFIISDLIHTDDKKSFVTKNEEANKRFIHFQWEGRLVINGNIVWVRLESRPQMLDNGDILWSGILHNITEQKLAEQALSEAQLQLQDVLEGANIGTLEWNVQTGKVKFNKIWAKNLGYTVTEIKIGLLLLGSDGWKTITHPDDVPYAENMLQRHFSGEFPYHTVEVRMRHKKGYWVWIRQEGKVKTWTKEGKPLLMYGTHTDISKRKEMELELRNNEEKYRILFDNNPQPMLIFNPSTELILEVNQAFMEHYGYNRKEIISMKMSDIRPAEDVQDLKLAASKVNVSVMESAVRRHKKKNGQVIYVELKSHSIKYNQTMATHLLINDITEQKRAEQALFELNEKLEERISERTAELQTLNISLQKTEEKFRTLTNFTYDWEYWKGPDNSILFMSPSVERITGYSVAEFETDPNLLDKIIQQSDSHIWELHKNTPYNGHPIDSKLESTFRIVTKNGDVRWIAHVCRGIKLDGKDLGVRVSNRDITDKVNAENELLNITVEVEERERNRFSSELHDGMGPLLSTIKLYFQWLADTTDSTKRELITQKGNYSIEMAIQTARELARGLSSQYVTNSGYVEAIKDFTQRINDTNKLKISFKADTNERFSGFFELMLYRITTELIKNTLTYAKATNIEICFNYSRVSNTIEFTYSDNGIGFDWDKIKRGKTGLGLMNIQQRVQILKGFIEITSALGNGMKTVIHFPAEENIDSN